MSFETRTGQTSPLFSEAEGFPRSRGRATLESRQPWSGTAGGVVNVAKSAGAPDLPERVELVRAALPDEDRARFEQELDEALSTAKSTRTCDRSAISWRHGGGWCSPASTAGERLAARSSSGIPNRWTSRTRSAATSPESSRAREAARCRDPVSSAAL